MTRSATAAHPDNAAPSPEAKVTPMMEQYLELKNAHADCMLFYRMGDFYELFFKDAEDAARTLGITLTKRGKHLGEDIPMCGVPVERSDDYLMRLIAAGYRVAVCEQIEDPAEAKKRGGKSVVKRDVVRLVTPGTLTEEALLEPKRANNLVAVSRLFSGEEEARYGLAWIDVSTGGFGVVELGEGSLGAEIARLDPAEVVAAEAVANDEVLRDAAMGCGATISPVGRDLAEGPGAERRLAEHFGVSTLEGFGTFSRAEIGAAALAVSYVERMWRGTRPPLSAPVRAARGSTVEIDAATRANLELTRTLSGERKGSLLATIDRTVTAAGGRLLADWLAGPLTDPKAIEGRLDAVTRIAEDLLFRRRLRDALSAAPDLSRALTRIAVGRCGPRDLAGIRDGLAAARAVAGFVREDEPAAIRRAADALSAVDAVVEQSLAGALADDLPLKLSDGGFIRLGFDGTLDEQRQLRDESRRVIADMQARYAELAGARTLRIKHTNFLGYFVEVPAEKGEELRRPPLSATFIHRQTLQGAMRFSTADLSDLEARIAAAGQRSLAIEQKIFAELAGLVMTHEAAIRAASDALAALDVAASLAELAVERRWVRPQIDSSLAFDIRGGRHPVVEAAVAAAGETFVANDADLSPPQNLESGRIWLITGPNMAGKSTFLRQNALIAILAQMGSYVPATSAHIGVVDRLFSRVGAADDLARGRSTFMVEMVETAAILNQATPCSLVILDEIGRGTATFDGLSIAWAAIEHLHEVNRCRSLFATHFHELTQLTKRLPRLHNVTVRVTEWNGDVVFLHEVVPGAADRSYGVQVAKLAGLPSAVVERARIILAELEAAERGASVETLIDDLPLFAARPAASPTAGAPHPALEALDAIDPDELTPRAAQDALYRLKQLLR
ncbi:DNA mismatch repair protein MutS [Agaricicola taiwanensis]|uniref:DNA mismatch repair protein MutS n=1 Tax=Agaricicola taiwanensis TaxID=591372 RepID=A0A8J3DYM6_9RHOB|nr:DNA mismatch repair protein MutS [Agaricicola taiwanensis]GGE50130.1 DNA mismatch repair protein MutS [Agaricicola taiwanensis]